jgi:hypothetical protein
MTLSNTRPILRLVPLLIFLAAFALYAATAAPGTLFGDPSEYQFIPAILGIAHPPGYAFYTLLAKLWQMLVPIGTIAFRTNLLAAAVGAWAVTAAYLIVRDLRSAARDPRSAIRDLPLPSLFAALSLTAAPDLWQHAIHANAHIVSAALAITHLWLLIRWWRTGRDGWLAVFAVALGLAAAHHPITLVGVPAYGLFILAVRPRILCQWRTLLALAGCLLLGLTPFLYYPLRSPHAPFDPPPMYTWEGFWGHVTARGLRVNLFHFGLADQPDRALVFWSLLRLQFPLPVIALAVVGLIRLVRRVPKPALLLLSFLATHLLFTLNTVQDVMAYLLLPFAALAVAAGIGGRAVSELLACAMSHRQPSPAGRSTGDRKRSGFGLWPLGFEMCHLSFVILLLLPWPLLQATLNLQRGISLRDFTAAEEWVAAVHRRFDGAGEGALLLSAWEYLTPLWAHAYTQGEELDEVDVKLVYVSASNPWAESVWEHIGEGPIYLPDYRPPVRDAGFRLVPEGPLYRVVAPPVTDPVPTYPLDVWADRRVHILGFDLTPPSPLEGGGVPPLEGEGEDVSPLGGEREGVPPLEGGGGGGIRAGQPLELTLYQSADEPLGGIWMPYVHLGPVEARWTTDSRLLTPQWLPGEVVVERYELPVPFTLPSGEYPLRLGYADLSGGRAELDLSTGGTTVELATVTVLPNADSPPARVLRRALANLDNQVALVGARARVGWQTRQAFWEEPLVVRAGSPLHLALTWRALASPRDSYTVFIHLTDGAGRYVTGHDYTPLGGACPTYLWFPKWLPGQTLTDPYRLVLPADLPPGDYWLEVGMYGMTSLRRLPVVDLGGSLAGDRVILGPVRVD